MIGQKRYYSEDYGWRQVIHGHVMTITHLRGDTLMYVCACGNDYVGPERIIRTMMLAHRMEEFPIVRFRLAG